MKMNKLGVAAITAAALILGFTACASYPKDEDKAPVDIATPAQSPGEKQPGKDAKTPEPDYLESDLKEGLGKYSGQADSNFIEIELDDKTSSVFQLSAELKEKFEELNLEIGDSIRFKYKERQDQNPEIIEITKS